MTTNQVMVREEGFLQRTKDGYFNANTLLRTWNTNNLQQKQLGNFNKIKETKDFIQQLQKEGIEKPYISKAGRYDSGVWMHPKLFIDFAMWLSVEFKSKVIDMVLDGLIISRTDAGDYYKEMSVMIMTKYIEYKGCKPPSMIYINEANMIREISETKGKERNELSEKQLGLITNLQKINTNLISKNVGVDSRKRHLMIVAESLR